MTDPVESRRPEGGRARARATSRFRLARAGAVVVLAWLLSLIWLTPGLVVPDGAGYYSYLPSMWIGHDLLFYDEWDRLGMIVEGRILHKEVTATGFLGNHWTIGTAVYWLPSMALADGVRGVGAGSFPRDGFSLPYNVGVVTATAFAGLLALLVSVRIAAKVSSGGAAGAAAIATWFGTPLLWYSLRHSTMSHAVSALACALVVAAALSLREDSRGSRVFLVGMAIGFAFIVRPQNLAIAIVPFILIPSISRSLMLRLSLLLPAGALLAALPQLVASWFIYGTPVGFLTGGSRATPFAAFEKVWTWEPLFSWYHGLVPWAPLVLVAIIGLILLFRDDRRLALAALCFFAAQWFINATMERSFWGATAFGQRRFLNITVFVVIGLAVFLSRVRRPISIPIVSVCTLWTMTLFFATDRISLARYYTPSELWTMQWESLLALPGKFAPFASVPPDFRLTVVTFVVVTLIGLSLLAFSLLRILDRPKAAASVMSVYFLLVTGLVYVCGARSLDERQRYRDLIARNQPFALLPGGVEFREGLLRDEIDYLTRSGRHEESARVERELESLRGERTEALRRLGASSGGSGSQ